MDAWSPSSLERPVRGVDTPRLVEGVTLPAPRGRPAGSVAARPGRERQRAAFRLCGWVRMARAGSGDRITGPVRVRGPN